MKYVTAAIIIRDNAVLLARRKPGESLSGYWEFPGGKIEDGETPQECLERELFEELSVAAEAGEIIAESEYRYEHGVFRILGIATTIATTDFVLAVHDQVEWVPLATLASYKLAVADIPIADRVIETFLVGG